MSKIPVELYVRDPAPVKAIPTELILDRLSQECESAFRELPDWVQERLTAGKLGINSAGEVRVVSDTGVSYVKAGNWVIQGPSGEVYPCTGLIFATCYTPYEPLDYIGRMKLEHSELEAKFKKLMAFLSSTISVENLISAEKRALMEAQGEVMAHYLTLLEQRIELAQADQPNVS
ncbi:TPA: hypothetical protein LU109_003557 [Enterobacter hormaechei subsp. xiangfangensis]|nr:hypothetical protein [Enterobacter hormaechei subsp. xiangfangensis]